MKSFPSGFAAKKNTPAGSKPVWFLALPTAADGSGIVHISDRVVTVKNASGTSVTTKAWVSSWGQLTEGISGRIGEFSVAEFRVHILNDPTDAENIVHIIDNHDIETALTTLCCWFEGISDNAQTLFTGYVADLSLDKNDVGAELLLRDASLKSEADVGIVATRELLGNALDSSDVGKILPIVFGTVSKVPAIRAVVPIKTTVTAAMSASSTSVTVSDATGLAVNMYLQIDSEVVKITAVSGQTLTITRGQNSTTAATHDKGSSIVEYKTSGTENFVFIAAGHAVTSIPKVWSKLGDEFYDITSLVTRYAANGWSGKAWATIKMPNAISVQQMTALGLTGVISAINNLHSHSVNPTDGSTSQNLSAYPVSGESDIVMPYLASYQEKVQVTASFPSAPGTITAMSLTYTVTANIGGDVSGWCATLGNIVVDGWFSSDTTNQTRTVTITDASAMNQNTLKIWYRSNHYNSQYLEGETINCYTATIHSASRSITYTSSALTDTDSVSANVGINNTLALSGTQIAATLFENGMFCDMSNTAADTPKEACDWLLATYGPPGVASVTSDNAIHTTAGNVNGCILEKKSLIYWLNRIAFEFRSRFKFSGTGAKLIYRPDTLTSAHTVTLAEIRNFTRKKSAFDDIINKIDLRYARDWSTSGSEPYTAVKALTDSASQAKFGVRERADIFRFDFVTSDTLANTIGSYYLARYKVRRWLFELELFLDNMELEYADIITIAMGSSPVGVITEAGITPGSASDPDMIRVTVEG